MRALRAAWRAWVATLIADDPTPAYSRLDSLDGLKG